ncbi:unnamed protein product [Moneuplotes crassus]|uniref:Saposin B-type domain-containing protein n=1 Tax=Euplotes crassus TaxID=5936 RepID=A0AAD1U7L7_EUPCR|nr:unnamed protein product [Moneuplotes crassus]
MKFAIFLLIIAILVRGCQGYNPQKDSYYGIVMDKLQGAACTTCKMTMSATTNLSMNSLSIKLLKDSLYLMCSMTNLNSVECSGILEAYIEMFFEYIQRKVATSDYLCEVAFEVCNPNTYSVLKIEDYADRVLGESYFTNDYIDMLYDEIEEAHSLGKERETMLIYQFTDIHLTLDYAEGYSNVCDEISCCKVSSGVPSDPHHRAGKWGDYNCDANPRILDQIKYSVAEIGEPDMILWTGDSNDHTLSDHERDTTEASKYVTKFLLKTFPDTVLFPIHGNHEFNPSNLQNMSLSGSDPIIETLADSWESWMIPKVQEEFKNQSFYSYRADEHPMADEEFKRKMNKTRIIAWNAENCYLFNFYLLDEDDDPGHEIEWLEKTLHQMEQNGEVAIIIGHISPGRPDCLNPVSSRIRVIHERYQHIIRLNIYGHTHHEELEVVRSYKDSIPIGVNFVSPSFSTFKGNNPAFRVFEIDVKTKLPVKIDTYAFDLEKANKNDKYAKFEKIHEMTEEYGLRDLRPSEFLKLATKLGTSEELAIKYLKNFSAQGRDADEITSCNESCRRILSCDTSYSTFLESVDCYGPYDVDLKSTVSYLSEVIYGEWVSKSNN